MTVVGLRLFLFGGHSGNKHLRDLHVLDTETMSWAQPDVQGVPPPGLRGHTANLIGHKIFVFGGYDGRGRSKMLFKLNTESLTWDHPPADEHTPTGRQRHTAVLVGSSQLYIVGGFDGFKWLNDLHVLDVSKLEETAITTAAASNLITNLRQLLNNQSLFPDITFVVEGKPIYAHKAILAVQCDQFQAMFTSGMKESRESEVVIPSWSYSAFLTMLEFLYTGRVIDFQPKIALDLLGLADAYTLVGLKRLCENMLIHNVDDENVSMLFSRSDQYRAEDLKKFCLNYVLKNYKEVCRTKGFKQLEKQLVEEVLNEVMSANSFLRE